MPTPSPVVKSPSKTSESTSPGSQPEGTPTPPLIPAVDPTPGTFAAPTSQAWMHSSPVPAASAQPRRLTLIDVPTPVGDRRVHFVMIGNDTADLAGQYGTRLRITLMPGPSGQRLVHVKGMTCFVALSAVGLRRQ